MPAKPGTPGREVSNANLSRTARRTHGAHSSELVDPLAEIHRTRLAGQFANPDPELLTTQSRRAAQMELLQAWLAKHGLMRRSPKGTVFQAAEFHERLTRQFEQTHVAMLDQDRKHGNGSPHRALAEILAEHAGGES